MLGPGFSRGWEAQGFTISRLLSAALALGTMESRLKPAQIQIKTSLRNPG
jgi:hypothetical protein